MGWRFQKRIRIFPGVTLNVGSKGVSTSFGVRGARITVGRGKTRTTLGLPGTGLSHTSTSSGPRKARRPAQVTAERASFVSAVGRVILYGAVAVLVFSVVFAIAR